MPISTIYIGPNGYETGREYVLLLAYEGPHVRIVGAVPHGSPKRYASQAAFEEHWRLGASPMTVPAT